MRQAGRKFRRPVLARNKPDPPIELLPAAELRAVANLGNHRGGRCLARSKDSLRVDAVLKAHELRFKAAACRHPQDGLASIPIGRIGLHRVPEASELR